MHLVKRTLVACVSCVGLLDGCDDGGTTAPQFTGTGQVTVHLTLSHLVQVNRVDYSISAPDLGTLSGTFKVGDVPSGRITANLSPVPAGNARTLSMSAEADNGALCEGTGTVDVPAAGMVSTEFALNCVGGSPAPVNDTEDSTMMSAAATVGEDDLAPAPQGDDPAETETIPIPKTPQPADDSAPGVMPADGSAGSTAPEPTGDEDVDVNAPPMSGVEPPAGGADNGTANPPPQAPQDGGMTASLVGTWISPPLVFETSLFAPALGEGDATVTQTMIAHIDADGRSTAQLCSLEFEETHVGLSFVSSVQMLKTPVPTQLQSTDVPIGATFPVSDLELKADGLIAMSSTLGGEVTVDVTVSVVLDGTVDSANTVSGTSSFTSSGPVTFIGLVLDDMRIPVNGPPPSAPFTITKVADDATLSCEQAAALLN